MVNLHSLDIIQYKATIELTNEFFEGSRKRQVDSRNTNQRINDLIAQVHLPTKHTVNCTLY